MRRLYLQIYFAFLAVVIVFFLCAALLWWALPHEDESRRSLDGVAGLLALVLPAADRPRAELQSRLDALSALFPLHLTVRSTSGEIVALTGMPLPAPEKYAHRKSAWMRAHGPGPAFAFYLDDGRTVAARWLAPRRPGRLLGALALLAVVMALGAYPIARRITRRVERLQAQVEALGSGDLAARVDVQGTDEIAVLARSFNRTADQIEKLVSAQRGTLASASHELRSPLARLRMGLELLPNETRPALKAQFAADIQELDTLVEELLLASRLESNVAASAFEDVDLLALAAEEAARIGAEASGDGAHVRGDAQLLRRLLRNLFENSRRHGGAPIEAQVTSLPGGAQLEVRDRGPGVPEAEREKIFEPFYRLRGSRESGEGVGLGLAIVRRIARAHGGEVRCLPREGGGTVFEVRLGAAAASERGT